MDRSGSRSTGRAAGFDAASRLSAPAVVLLAEPSGCNLFGSGRSIARAVPDLLRSVVLTGASHCDFEGPTNKFCQRVCGGSSPEMQSRAREETVAAVVEMLRGSVAAPARIAPRGCDALTPGAALRGRGGLPRGQSAFTASQNFLRVPGHLHPAPFAHRACRRGRSGTSSARCL